MGTAARTTPCTDAEAAFRAIWHTTARLRRLGEVRFARWNLSPAQWRVLRALDERAMAGDAVVRATDLCGELLLTKATMSGLLTRLVRMKLLSRSRITGDQRAASVALTGAGRALVATVRRDHSQWAGALMAGLTQSEQRGLAQTLTRLSASLDPLVEQATTSPGTGRRRAKRTTRNSNS